MQGKDASAVEIIVDLSCSILVTKKSANVKHRCWFSWSVLVFSVTLECRSSFFVDYPPPLVVGFGVTFKQPVSEVCTTGFVDQLVG